MAYIGLKPDTSFRKLNKQTITGNGGTAYTLTYPVNNSSEIEVYVNNVRQEPDVAYTATYTTLTMTGAVQSYDSFYVVYQGQSIGTLSIPEKDNSGNYNFDNGLLYIDNANNAVSVGTTNVLTSAAGKTTLSVSGSSGSYVTLGTAGSGLGSIFADTNFGINGSSGVLYIINSAANQPIVFQSGSSYTERMRIDSAGNIGIGNNSPIAKLHIDNAATPALLMRNPSSSGYTSLRLYNDQNVSNRSLEIDYYGSAYAGGERAEISVTGAYPLLFSTTNSERMRISATGALVIANTIAYVDGTIGEAKLQWTAKNGNHVGALGYSDATTPLDIIVFRNPNGTVGRITTNASVTAYTTSSDYRLKENVVPIADGIIRLKKLKPSRFNFKTDNNTIDGFLAHEVEGIVPEAVVGTKDAVNDHNEPIYQSIDASRLVPLLTAALQEQQAIIENLTARIEALET